jgi:transposase
VTLRLDEEQAVVVSVEMDPVAVLQCPKCQCRVSGYDSRERRWRHLDTMQYRTILVADVPRVACDEHGVIQITVPWSDPKSRFTALFEALVIDWLKEASFTAVVALEITARRTQTAMRPRRSAAMATPTLPAPRPFQPLR